MRSAGRDVTPLFPSRGKTSNHTPHTHLLHHALHCTLCVSRHVCVFLCCLRHCGLVSACERVTQSNCVHSTVPASTRAHAQHRTSHISTHFLLPPTTFPGVVGARVYSQRRVRSMRSAGRDVTPLFPSRGKTSNHTPHTHLLHHALHCTLCVSRHVCVFLCCLRHCGLVSACE